MALRGDAKRDYMRLYMRRIHGFAPRGVGKRESEGDLDPERTVYLDPQEKREFRPSAAAVKMRVEVIEYMAYLAQRGYTAVRAAQGYELVSVVTGELGIRVAYIYEPQDTHRVIRERQDAADSRILQLEANQARIEAILEGAQNEVTNGD